MINVSTLVSFADDANLNTRNLHYIRQKLTYVDYLVIEQGKQVVFNEAERREVVGPTAVPNYSRTPRCANSNLSLIQLTCLSVYKHVSLCNHIVVLQMSCKLSFDL